MTEPQKTPEAPKRPRPRLDAINRPFWTGGAEGKLYITHCGDCGEWTHPPREFCRHCQGENVKPQAVPGTGVILNNMLGEEDLIPLGFHAIAPGRRVPSALAAWLVPVPDQVLHRFALQPFVRPPSQVPPKSRPRWTVKAEVASRRPP